MYTFIVDTYFSIFFFRSFSGFQLPLQTFWLNYRAIFSIFCLIWQEIAFLVSNITSFAKLKEILTKRSENPGHFTKNSSISWQVGTNFEQKFQWEKLFRTLCQAFWEVFFLTPWVATHPFSLYTFHLKASVWILIYMSLNLLFLC